MYLPKEKLKVTAWFIAGLWSQSQEIWVLSLALLYDTSPVTSTFCASLPLLPDISDFLSAGCWGAGHKGTWILGTIPALIAKQ